MDDIGYFTKDGTWVSENPDNFKIYLSKFAQVRSVLKAKKWYKQRTTAENSSMHWLFTFIGNEIGYSGDDVKGWYKIHFKIPETSGLDTIDCEVFLEDVRRHASEFHGIYCPLPNEVIY